MIRIPSVVRRLGLVREEIDPIQVVARRQRCRMPISTILSPFGREKAT